MSTVNSRRLQLEEWRRKKEQGKTENRNPKEQKESAFQRRQTFSNVLSSYKPTNTQASGKETESSQPLRRQTLAKIETKPEPNRRHTFARDDAKPPLKRRHNFSKDDEASKALQRLRLEEWRKKKEEVRGVAVNNKAKESALQPVENTFARRQVFSKNLTERANSKNKQQSTASKRHLKKKAQAKNPVQNKHSMNKASELNNASKRNRLESQPNHIPETKPKSLDEADANAENKLKSKKMKFVASKIDTGLRNMRRPNTNSTTNKKPIIGQIGKNKLQAGQAKKNSPKAKKESNLEQQNQIRSKDSVLNKRRSCIAAPKSVATKKRRKTIGTPSVTGEANSPHVRFISPCISEDEVDAKQDNTVPKTPRPGTQHPGSRTPRPGAQLQRPRTPRPGAQLQGSRTPRPGTPKSPMARFVRHATPASKELAMRAKLNSWLTARGKTPSRYRHLMCFHDEENQISDETVDGGLSELELSLQQEQLERESLVGSFIQSPAPHNTSGTSSGATQDPLAKKLKCLLNECALLLDSGCPLDNVSDWLSDIVQSMPNALQCAQYWVIRAGLVEQGGGDNSAVIDVYEQAVRHHAAPPDEVADALGAFVARMNTRKPQQNETIQIKPERKSPHTRSQSATAEEKKVDQSSRLKREDSVSSEEEPTLDDSFQSSSIKYCMTQATPFFKKLRAKADGLPTPRAKVTPVRRSTRKSVGSLPPMLRDHDLVLESLDDLSPGSKVTVVYQSNKALLDAFDEAANSDEEN